MPIYTYLCEDETCQHVFEEVIIGFDNTVIIVCPKCGKVAKKIPSLTARMKANWSAWNLLG